MASELERFYNARAKAGINGAYGYDNDGNLVQRDRKGTVIKTITLPTYRHPTEEENDVMEKNRKEAIAVAERVMDEARSALYTASQSLDRDDSTMLRLNRAVMEADSKLVRARFPLMEVDVIATDDPLKIKIRQIDFTQPNNDRTVPYNIAILETRPFTLEEQYVRVGENPEMPLVSVAEVKSRIKAAEKVPVIVFEGTESDDYGYLSLDWAVSIHFNESMYRSAKQAIYAELAKFFNDQVHLPQILEATTADEVDYSLEDVPGENNTEKWNQELRRLIYEVNLAKFRQYPELAGKLMETKNAIIGAYLPGDNMLGTGISIENVEAKDSTKWGENLLGKTLMSIREYLQSEVAPLKKKSSRKPTVGKRPQESSDIPPIVLEEPAEESIAKIPIYDQPVVKQSVIQGGVQIKRTLRKGGQQKNQSP